VTRGELTSELAASLGLRHEARFIIEEVLGTPDSHWSQTVGTADVATIRTFAERRRAGEPLQYIFGHWPFRGVDLLVDGRVLIPRPETEYVVEVVLAELDQVGSASPLIVDAGTGSGAIALSLAVELPSRIPGARLWATDSSADALDVAVENLTRVKRAHRAPLVPLEFRHGLWLSPLPQELCGFVNLIVSNPPYVAKEEWLDLPHDVRCEPFGALVADDASDGTAGLGDVEQVLTEAWTWLARPGVVVIELAPAQAEAAVRLARALGYVEVRVDQDLAQRPRVLVGRAR